jgi:hypothetical protein
VELIAVIFMLAAGGVIAVFVVAARAIAERADDGAYAVYGTAPDRNRLAASLLYQVEICGGVAPDEARRDLIRRVGIAAPVTEEIDISNWGARYAQLATPQQRAWLLESAVQLVAVHEHPVPLRQYSALLDLSFALGFQTDALAKLREQYGFEYVDHAKNGRPREADRGGGATPLFTRTGGDSAELLRVLGIEGTASRQSIIAAYRRLAAQHHPDKFFGQPEEAQSSAATRFIEITRAYEALLARYRD